MAFKKRIRRRPQIPPFVLAAGIILLLPLAAPGQQTDPQPKADANAAAADNAAAENVAVDDVGTDSTTTSATGSEPTVWDLAIQGGLFMIPIGLASIVVIAFSIERIFGLRTNRILPPKILAAAEQLGDKGSRNDPRAVYRICQHDKSPLARTLCAALLKMGRPQAEVEKTVEDTVAREAARMANNIRPINVAASISPLLGLLGTVQGMIMAFMVTSTTTATGAAKGQELAQGIYTALVTTFSGLSVAIVAVLFAHYLEGRIDRLLRTMEELFQDILPQFEQFEGKIRVRRGGAKSAQHDRPPSGPSSVASPPPVGEKPPIQPNVVPEEVEQAGELVSEEPSLGPPAGIDSNGDTVDGPTDSLPADASLLADSANGDKKSGDRDERSGQSTQPRL